MIGAAAMPDLSVGAGPGAAELAGREWVHLAE